MKDQDPIERIARATERTSRRLAVLELIAIVWAIVKVLEELFTIRQAPATPRPGRRESDD